MMTEERFLSGTIAWTKRDLNSTQMNSCPFLPCPKRVAEVNKRRIATSLTINISSEELDNQQIQRILTSLPASSQLSLASDILFEVVKGAVLRDGDSFRPSIPMDQYWTSLLKSNCKLLVQAIPDTCRHKDSDNKTLLWYLTNASLQVCCSSIQRDLVALVASNNPHAVMDTCNDAKEFTPIHALLLHDNVDFELVLYLLSLCPAVAKAASKCGKLPIHSLMSRLSATESYREDRLAMQVLRVLLTVFPLSACQEITEDVRILRINTTSQITSQDGMETADIATSESTAIENSLSLDTSLTWELQQVRWTPLSKAKSFVQEVNFRFSVLDVFNSVMRHFAWRKVEMQHCPGK